MTGQSGPLHFKFSRDESDNVMAQYKGLNHRPWKKMDKLMLREIPKSIPKILMPSFRKYKFDLINKNIEKCKFLFSDIFSNTQYRWWKRYLLYLREVAENEVQKAMYGKKNARWLLPLLPKRSQGPAPHQFSLPPEVQEMIDKEVDDPDIQMRSPKKKTRKPANKPQRGKAKKRPTQRTRTIYYSYVYGYVDFKKQIFFFVVIELIELLFFLALCYIYLYTYSIIELLILYSLAMQSHIVTISNINKTVWLHPFSVGFTQSIVVV